MSLLLSVQSVTKAYGAAPLFAELSLGIAAGERIGLVGPNGSGKSTLLRVLAGLEPPDAGTRAARKLLRLAYVPQDARFDGPATVEQVLAAAHAGGDGGDGPWAQVGETLARLGFRDPAQRAATLSGGWAKRLAIGCALVQAPELLLMDEPTNHLDVEGILWLERLLRSDALAFLVVSHDRYFLESSCTRIVELNRCYAAGVLDHRGRYSDFLAKKDEVLRGQEHYRDSLANRLRGELEWLQRGAKARTRKSSARIDAAAALAAEHAAVAARSATRAARLELTGTARRTRRLLVVEGLAKRLGERPLFAGLDLTLTPGARLGVLGPNGSGKSTLLRVLAGELAPDAGRVVPADDLRVVYLSQQREHIDPALPLRRALAPAGDQVVFQERPLHVVAWAKRFLFGAAQLEMPVGRLSGGERARVAIARLMLRPADVLLLDEPTNDLDIPTLEILEENLLEIAGALVLVTHDRYLFERVTTAVIALDGAGGVAHFADYAQWEAAQRAAAAAAERPTRPAAASAGGPPAKRRRSYQEQREWDQMEAAILAAEEAVATCRAALDDPGAAADAVRLQERYAALQAAEARVEQLYARWAELEGE